MLVLQPSSSTPTDRVGGGVISVALGIGVSDASGVLVTAGNGVLLGTAVIVATIGVALLTPITTGVGECIDGVFVGGKNGVGGL